MIENLSKNLKQKTARLLLKVIEPFYTRLRKTVQNEIDKIKLREIYADAERRLKEFHERRKIAQPKIKYSETVSSDCNHRKGFGKKTLFTDYNLMDFTFIDGSRCIKCLTCMREWWHKDGFKDPDWDTALKMMSESTNTPNCSEYLKKL